MKLGTVVLHIPFSIRRRQISITRLAFSANTAHFSLHILSIQFTHHRTSGIHLPTRKATPSDYIRDLSFTRTTAAANMPYPQTTEQQHFGIAAASPSYPAAAVTDNEKHAYGTTKRKKPLKPGPRTWSPRFVFLFACLQDWVVLEGQISCLHAD